MKNKSKRIIKEQQKHKNKKKKLGKWDCKTEKHRLVCK